MYSVEKLSWQSFMVTTVPVLCNRYYSCDMHCRLWKHLLHPPNQCMSQWGTRLALIQQPGLCVFVASTEFQSQWDKQIYGPGNLYGRIHSPINEYCNIILCVCPQCLLKFRKVAFYKMSLVDCLTKWFVFARSQVQIMALVHSTMWFSSVHPCRWHLKTAVIFFHILSKSSFLNHPVIQCHVICGTHSFMKQTINIGTVFWYLLIFE